MSTEKWSKQIPQAEGLYYARRNSEMSPYCEIFVLGSDLARDFTSEDAPFRISEQMPGWEFILMRPNPDN